MANREGKLRDLSAREEQKRLTKAELLRPRRVKDEQYIAGLDGTVLLQSISHAQRQELRDKAGFGTETFDEDLFTMLSIVESIVDPKLTVEDLEALRKQDATIIDEFIVYISTLNMMGRSETLKKESDPIQSSDSV
jgi:hypothetical protein